MSLFTSVMGYVCAGRDLADLDVRIDGEPLPLDEDPVKAAASIMYEQLMLRVDEKPDVDYWGGLRRDLRERADAHRDTIAAGVARLADRFPGLNYRALDMWDHIEQVKDDPSAVISLSPPTYLAGYEKFFDTGGRMTWQGPSYGLFDPSVHFKQIAVDSQSWKALLLCAEHTDGEPSERPYYARRSGPESTWYCWTNRLDVLESVGLTAIPRPGYDATPLPLPILPGDHDVRVDSAIEAVRIEAKNARYYKELWAHRIDPKDAGSDWAVLIDGHLAGIAGFTYTNAPALAANFEPGTFILTYAFGPRHRYRLGRLVVMLALTRSLWRRFTPAWTAHGVERIITAVMTKHPEVKQHRGVLKLKERRPDPVHGFRLLYEGKIVDRTVEETLALWHKQERQRQQARMPA